MVKLMGVVNLTPDSFYEPSRVDPASVDAILERVKEFTDAGASIIDLGAVSTRPGAPDVPLEEEWRRLEPALQALKGSGVTISIDTTRAEIVRRAHALFGPFIVNDISAGEDDPQILKTTGSLGLTYIAMHKRGNPRTMDSMADYPGGVMHELEAYFRVFSSQAKSYGITDWILDPGLGFAKSDVQNWEVLQALRRLQIFGKPILIGAAEKRFTKQVPPLTQRWFERPGSAAARASIPMHTPPTGTDVAHALAVAKGAAILRVHSIPGLRSAGTPEARL